MTLAARTRVRLAFWLVKEEERRKKKEERNKKMRVILIATFVTLRRTKRQAENTRAFRLVLTILGLILGFALIM